MESSPLVGSGVRILSPAFFDQTNFWKKLNVDSSISLIRRALREKANPVKASQLQVFFKTGKGQYAEGDVFLGIVVPEVRKVAKRRKEISLNKLSVLLASKFHEERMRALLILLEKHHHSKEKESLVSYYLKNKKSVNNWDLVDISAHKILGEWLKDKKGQEHPFSAGFLIFFVGQANKHNGFLRIHKKQ